MPAVPPIATLLAFEAVARRRSFALAAVELHLTPSAVSHQVARLESHLDVRLFERSAHGVQLSAAGERYLSRVGGALAALTAASDELRQGGRSLYLHCAPSLAILWLLPRIGAFTQRHPEIDLHLSAAHTHSDFALGQADIDIRYGVPSWSGLECEALFIESVMPLASPRFLRRHRVRAPEDLGSVPLIRSTVSVLQWADWFAIHAGGVQLRHALQFDRAQLVLDAAAQGLGVAFESTTMGERHLRRRALRPVFDDDRSLTVQAHFAVYPARHARRPAVAAFLGWLREAVRQ